ncbi:MAG: bifunctional DNA primase/polymerase [Woeseiaceae bacterium]
MSKSSIEQAALDYLGRGWSVIPVREKAKRPAVPWKAYQEEYVSENTLHEWFQRSPEYNVAIVTGALSGLVVLDVDPRHGGKDSLRDLEKKHGKLPESMESITGGGGRHVYFGHTGGAIGNRVNIEPGIDLRGDGGCIVAPPSIHPSGKRYRWKKGHGPGEVEIAPLPDWLRS